MITKIALVFALVFSSHTTFNQQKTLVRRATSQIRNQLKVDVTPKFVRIKNPPCNVPFQDRMSCYEKAFASRPIFIIDSVIEKTDGYITLRTYGGAVRRVCDLNQLGFALVSWREKKISKLIIAHELAHAFGATHFTGQQIMDCKILGGDFWPRSRREVAACMGGMK